MNLLKETVEFLGKRGKSGADVRWVGTSDTSCSWQEFAELAKDIDYNNGFGGNEIEGSLKIVGVDWWMERGEYDGSEWWEFKTMPSQPSNTGDVELMEK